MDLIKTIEDGDEVKYESEEDSGSEGDEMIAAKTVTKKKKKAPVGSPGIDLTKLHFGLKLF
jgi:hypothetical protein